MSKFGRSQPVAQQPTQTVAQPGQSKFGRSRVVETDEQGRPLAKELFGGLETIATIGSGILAEPAAGIAGLGTLALTGGDAEAAEAVVSGTREALTIQPESPTGQRFVQQTGEAVGGLVESGRELIGEQLPEGQFRETLIEEGVGPALGGAALEAGASPGVAATVAGLPAAAVEAVGLRGAGAAGRVPTGLPSEAIKTVIRGGDEGRRAVDATVEAFEVATGQTPTLGQATGRQTIQAVESGVAKFPGGRPVRAQLDRIIDGASQKVQRIADDISTVKGVEKAGRVIVKGITGSDGFVERFQGKSGVLWNKVDELIPDEAPVDMANTKTMLDDSVRGGVFGQLLDDPKLTQIKGILDESPEVDYNTLKALRSQIGRKLGSNDLISDIPRAELKRLYGALTEDIKAAANASSPEALAAFERANKFTRAGHTRIDDFVERVTKKVDLEKVFDAVTKGGEGAQVINSFKRSLKPEEWNVVVSNVVRRLGKATPGRQDALGEAFSLDKFLTDYNKLGPAKKAMFSGSKELNTMAKDLDEVAKVAQRAKEASKELAGQSGTAQLASQVGLGSATVASLLSGNTPLAASLIGLVGVNRGAAHLMSSPRFVKWLAQNSRKGEGLDLAKSLGRLGIIAESTNNDAEARAIQEYIESVQEVIELQE